MPKVSQDHRDARRRQILVAAVECFSRDGFHRTTMRDIMRQSGLSPGALYMYFKSKEDMIEAIAAERHAREQERIRDASRQGETSAVVQRLIGIFSEALLDPGERKERRMAVQLWSEALRNRRVLRTVREGVDAPRRMLARVVQDGCERGDLPQDLDPDAMARVMIALFQGFILQMAWDTRTKVEPYVRTIEKLFLALASSGNESPVSGVGKRQRGNHA